MPYSLKDFLNSEVSDEKHLAETVKRDLEV